MPTAFDKGVTTFLGEVLKAADVRPAIVASPGLIDARLLKAPGGHLLPLANYNATVGQQVTLTIRVGEPVRKVASAYNRGTADAEGG